MTKKRWAATIVCVAAVLATAWALLHNPRPGHDSRPEVVAAFVLTDAFRTLGPAEQDTYLRLLASLSPAERGAAFAAAGLSAAQREAVLEVMYGAQPTGPVEQFAALRTPAERRAYLDRIIDAGGRGDGGPSTWDSAARKRMLENTLPDERVRLAEFVNDLNERRRQRGLGPALP